MRAPRLLVVLVVATVAACALPALASGFALVPAIDHAGTPAGLWATGDGALWFGTVTGDPAHLELGRVERDGTIRRDLSGLPAGVGSNQAVPAQDGGLWFYAQYPSRLVHLAPDGHVETTPVPAADASETYDRMGTAPDGRPWLATSTGYSGWKGALLRVAADGTVRRIPVVTPSKAGTGRDMLMVDADGRAWLPYDRGVLVVSEDGTAKWHPFADGVHLSTAVVAAGGGLWLVDRRGVVSRMDAAGHIVHVARSADLADAYGAGVEARDGSLWAMPYAGRAIVHVTTRGRVTSYHPPGPRWLGDPGRRPVLLAPGPGGDVWAQLSSRLVRIDTAPACQVPPVTGSTAAVARTALRRAGCRARVVRGRGTKTGPLVVVRQSSPTDRVLRPNARVTVTIARVSTVCRYDRTTWRQDVTNDTFVLYERDKVDEDGSTTVLEACTLADGRRWKVDTGYSDTTSDSGWGSFVVRGPWLVYESGGGDQYGSGSSIVVVNVPKHKSYLVPGSSSEYGEDTARLGAWTVNEDGVVATIRDVRADGDAGQSLVTEVDTVRPGQPPRHHASAPTVGSTFAGLALDATRVHWTQDGTAHVDPIDGTR